MTHPSIEAFDVLVIGAGISGISAGYHLQQHCPGKRYAILEARDRLGGTWDLFRYPGIRSDSDMHTFGFGFRPWPSPKAISDGADILAYLNDTVREYGIDRHIRYGCRLLSADWSSADACWTLTVQTAANPQPVQMRCSFLLMCSGYYDYAKGHTPHFEGADQFKGRIVHPQHWPADLDWSGQKVVIIGSGATAVTMVPAMAERAAHVTMLQRSPTWIASRPSVDKIAVWLDRLLPARMAHHLVRAKNVRFGRWFFNLCRTQPHKAAKGLLDLVRKQLPEGYDVEKHFKPRYRPWEQRLCLVPDGDLFKAIRSGRAEVVTDRIRAFTAHGIALESGQQLPADVIVTATGLELKFIGGIALSVDGTAIDPRRSRPYHGIMLSDLPNLALVFGYTNASWTLRADLVNAWVCKLINQIDARGARWCVPRLKGDPGDEPWADFSSGYFQRALDRFPRQGAQAPWRTEQDYLREQTTLGADSLNDPALEYAGHAPLPKAA